MAATGTRDGLAGARSLDHESEETHADNSTDPTAHTVGRASSGATDRVSLRGISAHGHHGVFDFERENGQRFVVDVTCWLDLGRAAATDDLADTLDYGTLAAAIVADIEGPPLNLIEALAARIAGTCLASPQVETVEVTVHKPEAPIDLVNAAKRHAEVSDVAVTLTRSRTRD